MWESGESVPYQLVLRVAGAELDAHAACSIAVLETPAGLILRFGMDPDGKDLGWMELSAQEVRARDSALRARRRLLRMGLGRDGGVGRYQGLLRALGYELEAVGAYTVLIEQVEDSLLVTYQYLRAEEGYVLRKRMLVLGPGDQATLLEEARKRRGH